MIKVTVDAARESPSTTKKARDPGRRWPPLPDAPPDRARRAAWGCRLRSTLTMDFTPPSGGSPWIRFGDATLLMIKHDDLYFVDLIVVIDILSILGITKAS